MYGILFTFIIAAVGMGLSLIPYVGFPGSMLIAIFIAVIYRHIFGYPEKIRSGIDISAKKILRLAIILYGFKLNIDIILKEGLGLLLEGAFIIALAIGLTMVMAKWMKADLSLSLLLAVGTGVCGAAAIAAVSPIAKAKEEDTALGVGIIALVGTVFASVYILLQSLLGISETDYGSWAGNSLHEIAHVAAASAPAGDDALTVALLAKLGRVFLLIPVCFLLALWLNRKANEGEHWSRKAKVAFPWFLLGFVIASLISTYLPIGETVLSSISLTGTFLLTAAMVGLGLNIDMRTIRSRAWKPTVCMLVVSLIISVVSYFIG
jgi:uncharacterized integral membrane protein (TIGR00698 family)